MGKGRALRAIIVFAFGPRTQPQGLEHALFSRRCAQTPQGSSPGRHQGQGDRGKTCRQDNPVTRHPVHTVECTLPEKVVAPEKCHSVDGPKTARLSKESTCKHCTAW